MTLNGRPFFGISGEMHFSRVSPDQWDDAVVKMKLGGVNIVNSRAYIRKLASDAALFTVLSECYKS